MIPDFKTYIGESVWADIHRRSNGEQIRKENDIDYMSLNDFYDYWENRYTVIGKTGGAWKDMECMNNPIKKEHVFSTPIEYSHHDGFVYTYCVEMTYDYKKDEIKGMNITYFKSFILDYADFKDALGPEYNVDDHGSILIVNGKYKFHHYIDIIDKLLGVVKKPYIKLNINESVWADIHKRSNGIQVRKEDDINKLNYEDLGDYINEHYKVRYVGVVEWAYSRAKCIGVSVTILESYNFSLVLEYKDEENSSTSTSKKCLDILIYNGSIKKFSDFYKKLKENYTLDIEYSTEQSSFSHTNTYQFTKIYPSKDIDNDFFIEILNLAIDTINNKNYEKNIAK